MDEYVFLHDQERLLVNLRPSKALLCSKLVYAIADIFFAAIFLTIVWAITLYAFAANAFADYFVLGAAILIVLAAILLIWRRVRQWGHWSFRATTERILVQHRLSIFKDFLHTIKWSQYQESSVGKRTIFDFFFGTRPVILRYGSADTQLFVTAPSLPFAIDLKHYLDKVDSAYRAKTMADIKPFVLKKRGHRGGESAPVAALLLAIALAWPQPAAAVTQLLEPFRDVPNTHPSYEAILYLQANHIVQGYEDDTYRPGTTINRAEFTKILVASIAESVVIDTCLTDKPSLFSDVSAKDWFAPYVCTAKKFGMAYGNPDGTYRPASAINFAEASTLLARNLGLLKQAPKPEALWYKPYIEALAQKHAIPVSITRFSHAITRAEMAEMMYRIKASIPPQPSLTYEQLVALSAKPPVSSSSRASSSGTSRSSAASANSSTSLSSLQSLPSSQSLQSFSSAYSGLSLGGWNPGSMAMSSSSAGGAMTPPPSAMP